MSIIPSIFCPRTRVYDPYKLDLWDPFHDKSLEEVFSNRRSAFANSYTDWKETTDAHIFKVDLPGFNKNEVKVEVEQDKVLKINGERKKEIEERNDKWHHVERSSGKFIRRFRLPENAKFDLVKAGLENSVLTVTVPKENGNNHGRLVEISE